MKGTTHRGGGKRKKFLKTGEKADLNHRARLEKYRGDIKFLSSATPLKRKKFLKSKEKTDLKSLIQCLSHLSSKLLYDHEFVKNLPEEHRSRLRKHHVDKLKILAGASSQKKKHEILTSQRGGGLLSSVWNAIKTLFSG